MAIGSHVDDSKRGGDIDLLVCPEPESMDDLLRKKFACLANSSELWVSARLISSLSVVPILALLFRLLTKQELGYETLF